SEADLDLDDRMDIVRLDPQWRCFFEGGDVLDLVENVEEMAEKIEEFGGSGEQYKEFIDCATQLSNVSGNYFFWRSVGGIKDTMEAKGIFDASVLKDVMSLRMGKSVSETIRGFVKEERVAQMLDHFTQYVGSNPEDSPAVLCGIAHMQVEEGISYPMGGTRAVPVALEKLARELGVKVETNVEITRLDTEGGRVKGVKTAEGDVHAFDAVISNSDAVRTLTELSDSSDHKKKFDASKYEAACSGVVLYLGLNKAYPELLHHNFVFSRDPEEEFEAIYGRGEPAPDPTCYVCAPAQTETDVAPEGGEALYVLVHTPYLRDHHNWDEMIKDYRQKIIDKLKTCAGLTDIEDRIVTEAVLTPQDIHDRYRVLNGAIYGLASHGKYTGAFKPANRSKQLDGLYLAGGAAHPGPGMPMVMMSGWIAADVLDQDLKTQ
ncbi:MAG: phytoene desaturase family protein, partial [Verrucomicrobiota bacterium]